MPKTFKIPARRVFILCCAMLASFTFASCSPTMNWREVRFEGDEFMALMPCKPEEATRTVTLVLDQRPHEPEPTIKGRVAPSSRQPSLVTPALEPQSVEMQLSLKACKVQGLQFTFAKLSSIGLSEPTERARSQASGQVQGQAQWQQAQTQAVRRAWQMASLATFLPAGSSDKPTAGLLKESEFLTPRMAFNGELIDAHNTAGMHVQWLWRESANVWYQAGVYATDSKAFKTEEAQTFFESLR
jgi:hypothetical protein